MDIELRHLSYVVAVAEELSFTRAAARLHLDQPSLSRQVRGLERRLGVELFSRTTRSVALTPGRRGAAPHRATGAVRRRPGRGVGPAGEQ